MDPNANLTELRALAQGTTEHRRLADEAAAGDSDDAEISVLDAALNDYERMAELVQALDEWLTKQGFLPDAWQRTPKVEILHERDPDEGCFHTVWVDGTKTDAWSEWNVDPGRGHVASEWVPAIEDINASTPEVAEAIRGAYVEAAENSPYVEWDLDEEGEHSIDDDCPSYVTGHRVFLDPAQRINVPVDRLGIDESFYEDGKRWRVRGKTRVQERWHFTLEERA